MSGLFSKFNGVLKKALTLKYGTPTIVFDDAGAIASVKNTGGVLSLVSSSPVDDGAGNQYFSGSFVEAVRAFVNFKGTGTVSVISSFGVDSITDVAVGRYQVNFTPGVMANGLYAAAGEVEDGDSYGATYSTRWPADAKSASAYRFRTYGSGGALVDSPDVSFTFFGGQ